MNILFLWKSLTLSYVLISLPRLQRFSIANGPKTLIHNQPHIFHPNLPPLCVGEIRTV